MDFKIPDKLTFKRNEVIRIAKLDGKVIDYWEREFGGFKAVVNTMDEKFYSRKDVELILKIKQWMIVERIDKTKIKKIVEAETRDEIPVKAAPQRVKVETKPSDVLKEIKKGLKEILTIMEENDKTIFQD